MRVNASGEVHARNERDGVFMATGVREYAPSLARIFQASTWFADWFSEGMEHPGFAQFDKLLQVISRWTFFTFIYASLLL